MKRYEKMSNEDLFNFFKIKNCKVCVCKKQCDEDERYIDCADIKVEYLDQNIEIKSRYELMLNDLDVDLLVSEFVQKECDCFDSNVKFFNLYSFAEWLKGKVEV